ncbi:MAG: adenylate kinase [Chlorobi bacterium]|jgi:adenylate kinase|nr:adenylate kinase [Chlorobiota bacterium]
MVHIIMFGPPGAGKGTQAGLLRDRLHFAYIATGDIFRHHIKQQTELGRLAQSYIDNGDLVPDEVTIKMLKSEMDKHRDAEGIIFDGFPRTPSQAQALEDFLAERGGRINAVFALEVPEEVLIKRILNRGKTSGRSDDTDRATIVKRLKKYREVTEPIKDFYREKGVLHPIDGLQDIESIHQQILDIISQLK